MEPVKIGLLGLGTVGQGTVTVLRRNAEEIMRRAGRSILVAHAAIRNLPKAEALGIKNLDLTIEPTDIVDDPSISVVVELMGG
ncbi:MAG TPA: homoserine dehydrogenase, partial [Gammaproteobacteria bacterium]|nr:homoserine dehydrogenase [Gammaproteobacteria bacterium]